jgi:hypothetical protein
MRARPFSGSQDTHQLPLPAAGHETVIKFVLSGPVVADQAPDELGRIALADDTDGLRERVAALEYALAEAQARMDAITRALAASLTAGAQRAEAGLSEPPRPRAAPVPAPGAAAASVPPPPSSSDRIALAVAPSYESDAVQAPGEAEPAGPERPAAPKARGLRRMISVLKHD